MNENIRLSLAKTRLRKRFFVLNYFVPPGAILIKHLRHYMPVFGCISRTKNKYFQICRCSFGICYVCPFVYPEWNDNENIHRNHLRIQFHIKRVLTFEMASDTLIASKWTHRQRTENAFDTFNHFEYFGLLDWLLRSRSDSRRGRSRRGRNRSGEG